MKIENFDMKRLACVLENYVVGYISSSPFNLYTYAQANRSKMTYPLWGDLYPDLDQFEQTNYHEFYHLLSFNCTD